MYASEKDLICYYKKETMETISSAKCPFLNRLLNIMQIVWENRQISEKKDEIGILTVSEKI